MYLLNKILSQINYGSVCNHITAVIWFPSTRNTSHLRSSDHHSWDTASAVFVNLTVAGERRTYPGNGISKEERIPKDQWFSYWNKLA